ncbi:conserved hypothetical protein [delta proteobacterium NaphS2]|nr:conserved hypothetical protein [delta proteobacterium NaphS2]
MTRKWLVIVLCGFFICCGISYAEGDKTDTTTLRQRQFVDENVFLSITNGSSLGDVTSKLGPAVRHQFTTIEDGNTWTLIKCFLHTSEEESYSFYQLLFRDGLLVKMIGWIKKEREEYVYNGTTATHAKPWEIEDGKYVKMAIEAPAVTPDQIRKMFKDAQETMQRYKDEGNIPRWLGALFAPAFRAKAKKGYLVNEKLRQKYDGCKVPIGMTSNEVEALYGEPLHSFSTEKGNTARIYGDNQYLGNSVDSFLIFSYVAVLFDSENRVNAVYSDGFFCNDWYPRLPDWRRDG